MSRQELRACLARATDAARMAGAVRSTWISALWLLARRYRILARDLTLALPEPGLPPGLDFRRLSAADARLCVTLNPGLTRAEMDRRVAEGQEAMGGWIGDHLVHCRWQATGPVRLPYLGLSCEPAEGDLLVLDVFTHPAHRRRGLHSASARFNLVQARERGFRRAIALIAWWNRASLEGAADFGYAPIGGVTVVGLGPLSFLRADGQAAIERGERLIIG